MHSIKKNIFLLVALFTQALVSQAQEPIFKKSSYAGKSVSLENSTLTLNLYQRYLGWGWGELLTPSGKLMAIIEHLGEVMLHDQDIPMRLVAKSYEKSQSVDGKTLTFEVQSVVVRDVLDGTSFDNWMVYPFTEPVLTGRVSFTLKNDSPVIKASYELVASGNYNVRYIRGPWLKVGESSFGSTKEDAILPGVDWAIGDEWTSGTDFFKDPWAMRVAPHPNKVSVPLMAISHQGYGIGLSWNPNQTATRWFNYREHNPQPVFASPNFVDRKSNHLMGLMVPDASIEGHENEIYAQIPLELKIGQMINFDAEIWLTEGNSVDVMVDYVKRQGLPEPSALRWSYKETLDRIANAYNTNFWHEGKGFGLIQRPEKTIKPNVPSFLERYVSENKRTPLAKELKTKLKWSKNQINNERNSQDDQIKRGEALLSEQNEDGSFPFNPNDIGKDDFKVATSFIEPMGLRGETALDITIRPATTLLKIGTATGDKRFLDAARKAFDFCLEMRRPEAGDFWETPLHAANLLAAGHAAVGNYLAYEQFNDEKYKNKAIYWMRTLLVFTHLWEPKNIEMLYNTKPVLSSSDWYFANWVRDHVQWEVLAVFSDVASNNLKWDEIDPEIDWIKYQKGITHAIIRWLNVSAERKWLPHNLPETYERYLNGEYEYAYPDTHNSVTGNYGGMMIMPAGVANNIYYLLDRQKK
ncbi:glycoside hydrolase family 88 protein [Marinoscillum furvescens]|uniref:Uncharacterized protein n=1 Tax=Marinoscillum furvescens DSM 4134 TaxID=1122208 RepID=A0A3D9L3T6_MARFU|nr:hypothetical protein [Marinoscillum furvescens]RED98348.1 hypothetical protein C7460_11018 [Marinoscillum furvescens DSM 4134]